MDKIFLSFWQRLLHTGNSYAYIALRQVNFSIIPCQNFILSSVPAKNFVSNQSYENEFKMASFLSKLHLTFLRENDDKMSHFLPPANAENS